MPDKSLESLLASRPAGRWRRLLPYLALLATVLLLLSWRSGSRDSAPTSRYLTEKITQGDLRAVVTATGTLEPIHQVTVGSELSGLVAAVLVTENDRVLKGQPLVLLDTAKLAEQTDRSRAALATAEAQLRQAEATVTETAASLHRLEELARRSEGLLVAAADLDSARATATRAAAARDSARAAVAEAESAVRMNEKELVKGTIRSPIDGIVLSRSIEPGQTVAASLQAPVLFTLAEDLRSMKLEVGVSEADVAKVASDQQASFSVDAWPGELFAATVKKVQYGSKVVENVVTYQAELEVANADLRLRPGMTATADIGVAERREVLLVPNAALRFRPPAVVTPPKKTSFSLLPRPPGLDKGAAQATSAGERVFVLRHQQVVEVAVKKGLTDGKMTEISAAEIRPGDEVVLEILGGE